jgi:hypothetical protein
MMRLSISLMALGVLALPGCPSPQPSSSNPTTLWLSTVGSDETRVQLVDTEPPPF